MTTYHMPLYSSAQVQPIGDFPILMPPSRVLQSILCPLVAGMSYRQVQGFLRQWLVGTLPFCPMLDSMPSWSNSS